MRERRPGQTDYAGVARLGVSRADPAADQRTMGLHKRLSAAVVGVLVASAITIAPFASATTTQTYSADTISAVRDESQWILGAQLADGAIANYTDKVAVWPYLANYAAIGLARATKVTGDPSYLSAAWRWLTWYQSHETSAGFVTDYTISTDGVEVSTGDMDSTDAYAGTFLYAVWTAYRVKNDRASLKRLAPGVNGAVRAIEATLDGDGLTWAKPSYHVKYLMDESEVFAGLRAASNILSTLGDKSGSSRTAAEASGVKAGVGGLWNPVLQAYDWAVHADGTHQVTTWSTFYPDALEQTWAVAYGLTDSARASQLIGTFTQLHPYWDQPASIWYSNGSPQPVNYWPVVGWALDAAGQSAAAATGAASIRSGALNAGRAWPYTPGISGQLGVLVSGGPDLP